MRTVRSSCVPLVLVVLVGCEEPIVRLHVEANLDTERSEFHAWVQEPCSGHDCFRAVHGFDVDAETPDGDVVTLEEREGELAGMYTATADGIAASYAFLIDDATYRYDSPTYYTAVHEADRITWDPPVGDGEQIHVDDWLDGSFNGNIGVGPYVGSTMVSVSFLHAGIHRIILHRERFVPTSEATDPPTPSGYVSFDRYFEFVVE